MNAFLIFSLAVLLLASESWAGPAQSLLDEAYERKDYRAVYEILLPLAQDGTPDFQYQLGFLMLKDDGNLQSNTDESKKWFRKAASGFQESAEAGDLDAQYALGNSLVLGSLGEEVTREGLKWIMNVAHSSNESEVVRFAQYDLGHHYYAGVLVPRDLEIAADWLARVAQISPSLSREGTLSARNMLIWVNTVRLTEKIAKSPTLKMLLFLFSFALTYVIAMLYLKLHKKSP